MKDKTIGQIIEMPIFEEYLTKESKRLTGWQKEFYNNNRGVFASMYKMAMNKTLSNSTQREREFIVAFGTIAFRDAMSALLRQENGESA